MNILINFSTLKAGGGQNVAMNFLHSITRNKLTEDKLFYFVAKGSAPCEFLSRNGDNNFKIVPRNPVARILFELFCSWYYIRKFNIDIIYSYFGFGLFPPNVKQVTGSADSNLYFPEIDFWKDYTGFPKLKKKLIDLYRICGIKICTAVIFENPIMQSRAKSLFNLPNTTYIKPSVNFDFEHMPLSIPELNLPGIKCLFLCGWQLNKNIMKIPAIAAKLKTNNTPLTFIVTAPKDQSKEHLAFIELAENFNVTDMIKIIGPVEKQKLASLFRQVDYIFLLSKLESFSNNIIEAWNFGIPLIISDEPWSRAICKDAAAYVDRESVEDISQQLLMLVNNSSTKAKLIQNGYEELKNYPSIDDRINLELQFLRYIYETC